jgi:hypothetical protein
MQFVSTFFTCSFGVPILQIGPATRNRCINLTSTCILDAVIKQANWDCSKILEKVRRDIEDHALSVRESKLSELTTHAKVKYGKMK